MLVRVSRATPSYWRHQLIDGALLKLYRAAQIFRRLGSVVKLGSATNLS